MRLKLSAIFVVLIMMFLTRPTHAQQANCQPGRELITIPEIKSQNGRLQGTILLGDEERSVATKADGSGCSSQRLRFFKAEGSNINWPSTGDPIPGPTLRTKVGDWVEVTFLNQVNPKNFPNTLDQGEEGKTPGCDIATAQRKNNPAQTRQIYPRNDQYPNCLHGSSTANIHYHGTHTTPSTTGDNVLLFIHPALRDTGKIEPENGFVHQEFAKYFQWCEKNGPAQKWEQLPVEWQNKQKELLEHYDQTAPYKGVNGALPANMKLWPKNAEKISQGLWPQYSIGAYPYCFRLPVYDPKQVKMGQAPGTHWYHAHKHGSTALNVGNGMTGALIIEGEYDAELRDFYKPTPQHKNWGLTEKVLVIQQLETSLNMLSGTNQGQTQIAPLEVNGRLNPIVMMKPNQVQLWRIINGAARNFVQFEGFPVHGEQHLSVAWRQIAQDGVQFAYPNYVRVGTINAKFKLATANRADLLVKSPSQEGDYALQVVEGISDVPTPFDITATLLTVRVKAEGPTIDPPMDFIQSEQDFPKFPAFLADIYGPFYKLRKLYFDTTPESGRNNVGGAMPLHKINGQLYTGEVEQKMTLNTVEEWTLYNQTPNIAHPFHIHINPFQITEIFQPNTAEAKDPNSKCYANPTNPDTWHACQKLAPPWVWWDVFEIPTARQDALPASVCTELAKCPADIQQYTTCTTGSGAVCTVTIPGYFTMRSRFADFTGQYVLHCHILAHEDRGMMELVEVTAPEASHYTHD
jgi:FtsP/CotA-like multicopper oxidase with cupredoxin domain